MGGGYFQQAALPKISVFWLDGADDRLSPMNGRDSLHFHTVPEIHSQDNTMVAKNPAAPEITSSTIAMSDLPRGGCGRVVEVQGQSAETIRLRALGLCEGRSIEVLRTGEAWIVRVLGSRIGISRELVSNVVVAAA